MLPGKLLPQADILDDVFRIASAVDAGIADSEAMAAYIGKVPRQGRYYRAAAESIKPIRNDPGQNASRLLPLGAEYLSATPATRAAIVQRALLTNPAIHAVLAFIHASGTPGVTEADVATFLTTIARVNHTTALRREATIRAWLVGADLVSSQHGRLVATVAPERVLIRDADDSGIGKPMALLKPLVTSRTANVPSPPGASIEYVIDAATHERARREHRRLVEAMAATITASGAIPEANKYVDLAATIDSNHYLFEMKSTTSESLHAQVRRAIAQLYEYRYLQELPVGVLCLVLDRRSEGRNGWLIAYLEEDRGIAVCWLETSGEFACSAVSAQRLPFLR